MAPFDLEESVRKAESRLKDGATRRPRSDAGESRLAPAVAAELARFLGGQERPPMREVQRDLAAFCRRRRLRPPARATIYRFIERCQPHVYRIEDLPPPVRAALYNLGPEGDVPGHQLAFHCFQNGDTAAMSFAAGLPWLDLYQADRMRGWRPRSHGLLEAVLRRRSI